MKKIIIMFVVLLLASVYYLYKRDSSHHIVETSLSEVIDNQLLQSYLDSHADQQELERVKNMSFVEAAVYIEQLCHPDFTPETCDDFFDRCLKEMKVNYPEAFRKEVSPFDQRYFGADRELRAKLIPLNKYIFLDLKVNYDFSIAPEAALLSNIILGKDQNPHRRQGNCVSMPHFYLCLGEKLGWPLKLVATPQHLYVRWVDDTYNHSIECTSGGGGVDEEKLIRQYQISDQSIKQGVFMRNLSQDEAKSTLYVARFDYFLKHKNEIRKQDIIHAVSLNNRFEYPLRILFYICLQEGEMQVARELIKRLQFLGLSYDIEEGELKKALTSRQSLLSSPQTNLSHLKHYQQRSSKGQREPKVSQRQLSRRINVKPQRPMPPQLRVSGQHIPHLVTPPNP